MNFDKAEISRRFDFIKREFPGSVAAENDSLPVSGKLGRNILSQISSYARQARAFRIHQINLRVAVAVADKSDVFSSRCNRMDVSVSP